MITSFKIGLTSGTATNFIKSPTRNGNGEKIDFIKKMVSDEQNNRWVRYIGSQKKDISLKFVFLTESEATTLAQYVNSPIAYYVELIDDSTNVLMQGYYYLVAPDISYISGGKVYKDINIEFIQQ